MNDAFSYGVILAYVTLHVTGEVDVIIYSTTTSVSVPCMSYDMIALEKERKKFTHNAACCNLALTLHFSVVSVITPDYRPCY